MDGVRNSYKLKFFIVLFIDKDGLGSIDHTFFLSKVIDGIWPKFGDEVNH